MTLIATVRLLIMDPDGEGKELFSDANLTVFLELNDDNVFAAAESACLAMASDKARLGKFTLEGFADNEAAAANLFLRLAEKYAAKALLAEPPEGWDVGQWPSTEFAARRL